MGICLWFNQSFKECNNIERFARIDEEYVKVEELLIDCIFESQVPSFDYISFFKTNKHIYAFDTIPSPLSRYALVYCIANSAPDTRWFWSLVDGSLSTKNDYCGIIAEMSFTYCSFSMELFKQCPISILENIHHLKISRYYHEKHVADIVHLGDVIPLCKKLSSLALHKEEINTRCLNQLCGSNVSILELHPLKLTSPLTPQDPDILAAMAKLIHPSSGNLKSLTFDFVYSVSHDVKEFYDLVFASSSLHELQLYSKRVSIRSSLHLLETNSSITFVALECDEMKSCSQSLVNILQHNNVLQRLRLSYFHVPDDVDILGVIIKALQANSFEKFDSLYKTSRSLKRTNISVHGRELLPSQLR